MNRLNLCPLQSSYSVQFGCNVSATDVDGGFSRYTREFDSDSHIVAVSYQLRTADYEYLLAFYRVWQASPNQRFLMSLIINDSYMHDYECVFVPKSLNLVGVNGNIINVAFSVEAYSNAVVGDVRLSSKPYVFEFADSIRVGVGMAGSLRDVIYRTSVSDALKVAVGMTGTLRNVRVPYSFAEKLQVSMGLSGQLKLVTKTAADEKLQVSVSVSGNLKNTVKTDTSENLKVTVGISGTLS